MIIIQFLEETRKFIFHTNLQNAKSNYVPKLDANIDDAFASQTHKIKT